MMRAEKNTKDMDATAMVDTVIGDASAFSGEKAEQEDDMTVVVVNVLFNKFE